MISQLNWSPGIGDPTPMGWFTVAAYMGAALLCMAAALQVVSGSSTSARSDRKVWMIVAALFLLLCINKQLDLQTLFTELTRRWAKSDGWYDHRRYYQRLFIALMALVTFGLSLAAAYVMRRRSRPLKIALIGLAVTCCFVVVRAASFHHVDLWLGETLLGIRWNWLLELGGIGIVAAAAASACVLREERPRRR